MEAEEFRPRELLVCSSLSLKTWEPGTPVVRVPAFVWVWRQETNAPAQRQSGGEREFSLPLPFCFIQAFTKVGEANLHRRGRLPYSAYRFKHESHAESPSQTRQRVGPTTCAAMAQSSWRVKLAHPAGPSCIVLPLNCGKRPYMRLMWVWPRGSGFQRFWGDTLLSVREVGPQLWPRTAPSVAGTTAPSD